MKNEDPYCVGGPCHHQAARHEDETQLQQTGCLMTDLGDGNRRGLDPYFAAVPPRRDQGDRGATY